jgi:hypothetical protein
MSGNSRGLKENLPEEMQHSTEEVGEEAVLEEATPEEAAPEEEEEAMEMARLHGSGWNGRFEKALDWGGRGKEREAGDGWAGWLLASWAPVTDYLLLPPDPFGCVCTLHFPGCATHRDRMGRMGLYSIFSLF